jgi:hypothetical protein
LEDEAKGGFVFAVDFGVGVDATKELEESPEDEAEEEGITFGIVSRLEKGVEGEYLRCVSGQDHKSHCYEWIDIVLEWDLKGVRDLSAWGRDRNPPYWHPKATSRSC